MPGKKDEKGEDLLIGEGESANKILKRILYTVGDISKKADELGNRVSDLEDFSREKTGESPTPTQVIPPKAFATQGERAAWETTRRQAAKFRVAAVSSTGLLGTQQEETLSLLEERQGFDESKKEAVIEVVAHLTRHELAKRALVKKDRFGQFAKLVPIIGVVVVGAIVAYGLLQPQNFQLIVNSLQDPRTAAILALVFGTIIAVALYVFWIGPRRRARQAQGG